MKKFKKFISVILFIAIFCVLFYNVNRILQRKWEEPLSRNQERYTTSDVYDLDENSVDVVVLGTSQVVAGIDPVVLYDEAGISAYNLGGSSASVVSNYYWMQEICKRQSPKLMIFDVSYLFQGISIYNDKKMLDGMHINKNKIDCANALLEESKSDKYDFISLIIPIFNYHSRWDSLEELDFHDNYARKMLYRGYNLIDQDYTDISADELYLENESDDSDEECKFKDYEKDYLYKIYDYCQENGIALQLIKTPKTGWKQANSDMVQELANEMGVNYVDFNYKSNLDMIDFDIELDMKDPDHFSADGSLKFSKWLASYLKENYDLPDKREDASYSLQIDRDAYNQARIDASLVAATEPIEWLEALKQHSDVEIFITSRGSISEQITPEIAQELMDLGLQTDYSTIDKNMTFAAYISDGKVVSEECGTDVSLEDTVSRTFSYDVDTYMNDDGSGHLAIYINDEVHSIEGDGLQIVVYDAERNQWVETVSFDLENNTLKRSVWADTHW